MKKFLMLFAAAALLVPAAGFAQTSGEIVGSTVLGQEGDIFQCGRGLDPCNLHVRIYNEVDPTDFLGAANPVDGFPAYRKRKFYQADSQLTGNYPSSLGLTDLNWFAVWDGVTNQDRFDHVGYFGAQSQVVSFGELGNSTSSTCLPVVSSTACFLALAYESGNDLDGFGPAGAISRLGGLSPIPRPTVWFSDSGNIDFIWEEAAALSINDGAPNPVKGYKLYFMAQDRSRRLGPSESELRSAEALGNLIEATPGMFLPLSTTSFTLAAGDPVLAGFDPAGQRLVAAIRLVYAQDVASTFFSANSYPVTFQSQASQVSGLRGRLERHRIVLDWQADSLAGVGSFSLLRASQSEGPYHPITRQNIQVSGMQGNFVAVDILSRRMPERASNSLFYRLEVTALDGSRTYTDPVEVDITELRRGANGR
ncbi:MAG: hypothetical protein E2P03_01620 [Acidobacteria bacterium]|nr:MAG: hypothetical protein E2P03_01620 [Acidobacteriota bacterium]